MPGPTAGGCFRGGHVSALRAVGAPESVAAAPSAAGPGASRSCRSIRARTRVVLLRGCLAAAAAGAAATNVGGCVSAAASWLRAVLGLSAVAAPVVTYAHYACVADCADAMADAWEDNAGCAQAICLHENLLK